MSSQFYIAHTGICLRADPRSFKSIDNLKSWISQKSKIDSSRQILMTARGKQVKLQTLLVDNEIFVYNRDLLVSLAEGDSRPSTPRVILPEPFLPIRAPDLLTDESSLEAWQKLFQDRRAWAIELSQACEGMLQSARRHDAEATVIQRATAIAVENVKQHVGALHKKHEEAVAWAIEALQDHKNLTGNWNEKFQHILSIPANKKLLGFFRTLGSVSSRSLSTTKDATIQDIFDVDEARAAASLAKVVTQRLKSRVRELDTAYEDIVKSSSDLVDNFSKAFSSPLQDVQESAVTLAEEVEAIIKKMSSDYENILNNTNNPKTIATVSKTALLHTRNFIPSLMETVADIDRLLHLAAERKNDTIDSSLSYLQKISAVESHLADIQSKLAGLDIGQDGGAALETVSWIQNLPSVYGSLLIEAVRRREWNDRMRTDTAVLAEEVTAQTNEEEKRRRKWLKTSGNYLNGGASDIVPLDIEINLKAQEQQWPNLSRDDIGNYTEMLKSFGNFEDALKEMRELAKILDAPSKQQIRRANAFKHGSIHDAAFGRASIMTQADDELMRSLANEKSKLEDRLKGSESRVRKLEDLLHRQSQSQIHRPTSGPSERMTIERHATSPVLHHVPSSPIAIDVSSRRSSVSSRRFSANHGPEEKQFAQKVVRLEAELIAEKARSMQLQDIASNNVKLHDDLKIQVDEAISTKNDLMANFESQKHEFETERRSFGEDNSTLKIRVEELEEELERLFGSHDNARAGADDRVKGLNIEIENIRRDAAEELSNAQAQIDFLKSDYAMQRENSNRLERQVQQQEEDQIKLQKIIAELQTSTKIKDEALATHKEALRATLLYLGAHETIPDDFGDLVVAVNILGEKTAAHLEEMKIVVESIKAENSFLEARSIKDQDEVTSLRQRLSTEEAEASALREQMAANESHITLQIGQLKDAHVQLEHLQSKYMTSKDSSEELRRRITAEEKKVTNLTNQLASVTAATDLANAEAEKRLGEIEALRKSQGAVLERSENRAHRAEEISSRLFSHVSRLSRLLEHIGFTITKEDDVMTVQRTPRASTANSTVMEQSQSINRSLPIPLVSKVDESPPEYLHWAMVDDPRAEQQSYERFMREVQNFNMDTFSEVVIKRVKEVEHTARKWQREAKSYREKFHHAQIDAHEKIAYRSFKEGDLALFLPTRNRTRRTWAAFNVGAPHYFLNEQDSHKLKTREWIVARISKTEDRTVDLSKSVATSEGGNSLDDDNPFELSDGLRWYLLEAAEEKSGAPSTPGLGKSTVASAHVDAKGSIQHRKKASEEGEATRTLTKSLDTRNPYLDSRRSSSNSKKSVAGPTITPDHKGATIIEGQVQSSDQTMTPATGSPSKAHNPNQEEDTVFHPFGGRSRPTSPLKHINESPVRLSRPQSPQKSPEKGKGKGWASLWSLDLSLESNGKKS